MTEALIATVFLLAIATCLVSFPGFLATFQNAMMQTDDNTPMYMM